MAKEATRIVQQPNPSPKPFLKWAGGKSQLVGEILKRFPTTFRRYHEPFLGGGAVFFALQPRAAVLSDVNRELVETYLAIRNDVDNVIRALSRHQPDEAHYYKVRAQSAAGLSLEESAARTIFLNKTCFNGLYRVNRRGEFNVPFGRYRNPKFCDPENLSRVAESLQRAELHIQSVFDISRRVRRGDLVYFDPPYDPVSKTSSFTAYAKDGFGREEQIRLAELFARLAKRGVHVVLSNSDTPFIQDLYKGFRIDRVYARRAINARADRRGPVGELIISAVHA